jgi:RNA polymerase sigma-54 factor
MTLRQVIAQRPTVTPQLVMANTLLQLSSTELEQAIAQELAENPALELVEAQRCPKCGQAMSDGRCPACKSTLQSEKDLPQREYASDSAPFEWDADDGDSVSRLASSTTLVEHLLSQARLSLSPQDLSIAAYLVENLDSHGLLRCGLDEAASLFGTDRDRVARVISALQELEPVGIAARDTRECLLIQLEHLRRQGIEQPLAHVLIDDHWETLGTLSLVKIAQASGATVGDVRTALQFIRENLNPFPAHANWTTPHESPSQKTAVYPRPDVIIKDGAGSPGEAPGKYAVELPDAQAYKLRISPAFLEVMHGHRANRIALTEQDMEEWKAFYARARLFIKGVEQRWQALRDVVRHLVEYQGDFLDHGDEHLKPLTRAQLADTIGVHESTVSRAVADKYVQLPAGRITPLATFFDSSVPAKAAIKELIAQESKPLNDRELVELLAQRGHRVARRTVAKYRQALDIPPSSVRRQRLANQRR